LTQEAELNNAMMNTVQEITEVVNRMELMKVSSAADDHRQLGGDAADVIEDFEAERDSLQSARVLVESLSSETQFRRTGQRIRNVDMSKQGQLLVSLINTQERSDEIEQDISSTASAVKALLVLEPRTLAELGISTIRSHTA
jgi:hypothetical protein